MLTITKPEIYHTNAISATFSYKNLHGVVFLNPQGFATFTTPDYIPYWVKRDIVEKMQAIQKQAVEKIFGERLQTA
jgi:hypothetical protein